MKTHEKIKNRGGGTLSKVIFKRLTLYLLPLTLILGLFIPFGLFEADAAGDEESLGRNKLTFVEKPVI